jgi:hypothetical protein
LYCWQEWFVRFWGFWWGKWGKFIRKNDVWNDTEVRLERCHYALDLRDTFVYGLFAIKKSEELINIGYNTAQKHMSEILEKLKS